MGAVKNIKRRGAGRHPCFRAIKHSIFNFSLALSVGARSAVSLWLTIVDSFISNLSVPLAISLSLVPFQPFSLTLSRPLFSSLSAHVRVSLRYVRLARPTFRSLCCFNFFRGFPFRAASLHPGPSTILPFESPSRIERIPSNYLTLRAAASVCLVEIRRNPGYRDTSYTR